MLVGDSVKTVETIRRSVTIKPDLDTRVRDLVAACIRHNVDIDYTKTLNLFAELGERWLEESTVEERRKLREVWSKYLDYDKFEESVKADWIEMEEFRRWKMAKARKDIGKIIMPETIKNRTGTR
jgi:hypothetical protein